MSSTDTRGQQPGAGALWLIIATLAAIAVLGSAIAAVLWTHSERVADQTELESMARLTRRLDAEVRLLTLGFGGARLLAEAGAIEGHDIDSQAFSRFAAQLVEATTLSAVAFEPVVSCEEREQFEANTGITVSDPSPDGFTRAPDRTSYLPVRTVYPATSEARRILGFDIAADPTRGQAARDALRTNQLEFSAPLRSQPSGEVALFVVKALVVNGQPVATVSTAIAADDLVDEPALLLPEGTEISVLDGEMALYGSANVGGQQRRIKVGERTWSLHVDHPEPDHSAALSAGLTTISATGVLGFLLLRVRRRDIELVAAATTVKTLSVLGERLAHCNSRSELVEVVANGLAEPVGADFAAIMLTDGTMAAEPGPTLRTNASVDSAPLLSAMNVVIHEGGRGRAESYFVQVSESADGSLLRTITALPLTAEGGDVLGAVAWGWRRQAQGSPQLRSTIDAIRVVCQTALLRVAGIELQARRTHALYTLGQALSVAHTEHDIARAVVRHGPDASGFETGAVAYLTDEDRTLSIQYGAPRSPSASTDGSPSVVGDDLGIALVELAIEATPASLDRLRSGRSLIFATAAEIDADEHLRRLVGPSVQSLTLLPLRSSSERLIGVLVFASASPAPGQPGNLPSISDLVAQTLERAQLFEQQTAVVLQLQQRTLPPVGDLAGVTIKGHYEPAAQGVGIGGDWYDAEKLADGRLLLIVGDVVGHGITAVVDMVEISGMIAALARADSDLGSLPRRVFELVDDPTQPLARMATAIVMKVDPIQRTAEYVRMGHPPPMIVDRNGDVSILDGGSHPPIGVEPFGAEQAEIRLPAGATIVLYTDGLIERRHEDITIGVERLRVLLSATAGMTPQDALASVIERCGEGHAAFDDVALILARLPES